MDTHARQLRQTEKLLEQVRALTRNADAHELSTEARTRLKCLCHFLEHGNAATTSRRFGIARSTLYGWLARADLENPESLENRSSAPKRVPQPETDAAHVELIRQYRVATPTMSKERISEALSAEHGITLSAASVGRVIQRHGFYFGDSPLHERKRKESGHEESSNDIALVQRTTSSRAKELLIAPTQTNDDTQSGGHFMSIAAFVLMAAASVTGLRNSVPTAYAASSMRPTVLVSTEAQFIIDDDDTTANITLLFGDTLAKSITFNRSFDRFTINDDVYVEGSLRVTTTVSGAFVYATKSFSGAGLTDCSNGTTSKLLWDAATGRFSCGTDQTGGGSLTAGQGLTMNGTALSVNSTLTGTLLKFATATGSLARYLTVSGGLVYAERQLSVSGSTVFGDDNGDSVVFNADVDSNILPNTNNSYDFGSSSARWANLWGNNANLSANISVLGTSLLTGNVGIGAGNTTTKAALNVSGVMSGVTVYATKSFSGAGLTDCQNATTSKLLWNATTGRFSCGTDTDTNTTYTAGQGLSLNGTSFRLNQTVTGAVVQALNSLASSGSLTWKGTGSSGSSLHIGGGTIQIATNGSAVFNENSQDRDYRFEGDTDANLLFLDASTDKVGIGTVAPRAKLEVMGVMSGITLYATKSFSGAGLTDCQNATTSKLLWNATTGRFSCGTDTDTDTNTTYTAGQGLTLTSTSFKVNATLTGTLLKFTTATGSLVRFQTVSGSTVFAKNSLISSGSLVVENSISAQSLTLTSTISGATMSLAKNTNRILSVTGALVWYVDSTLATGNQQSVTWTMPFNFRPNSVKMNVKTAPTGAAIIVNIKEGGTTIFSTKPQINASSTTQASNEVFSDTSLAKNSVITLDIDQVGSTVAGESLSVMLMGTFDM